MGGWSMKKVEVAAAVIEKPDGSSLGRRPPNGIYAGWWEFPGGKVVVGETLQQALVRELERRSWASRSSAPTRGSCANMPMNMRMCDCISSASPNGAFARPAA